MSNHPKYRYADLKKLRDGQREALEDFVSGASDVLKGTAMEYAAPFANTAGTLLAGTGQPKESVKLPPINSSGKYKGIDRQALRDGQADAVRSSSQALLKAADAWKQSGAEKISSVKQELTPVAGFAVDVGSQGLKMLGDKALGAATGIGATPFLALRTFGDAAQTAREEGANAAQQFAYGVSNAISGTLIEKVIDGVGGIYGAGRFDEKIRDAIDLFAEKRHMSEWDRAQLQNVATALLEGTESVVTSGTDNSFKSIYNKKDLLENLFETDLEMAGKEALHDFLIALVLRER